MNEYVNVHGAYHLTRTVTDILTYSPFKAFSKNTSCPYLMQTLLR